MQKEKIVLYGEKKNCCGCGACMNICQKNAITMIEDENGFVYPVIDENLCIKCGMCKKVCAYQKESQRNSVSRAYVGAAEDENILKISASGGIFRVIAQEVIRQGGVVFGCAYENNEGILQPKHIMVEDEEQLKRLQGSKYVQSSLGNTFVEVKALLNEGKIVLFSGTPCQIDALYGFLQGKKYENLFTIDIICHGVPSSRFLQDYIVSMERRLHGKIINVVFRDKSEGWGLVGSLVYVDNKGRTRKKRMPLQGFSYYKMFLISDSYRENCYSCKYANMERIGDLTIGDYWGIEEEHPEYLLENGGEIDAKKGTSCILVNTNQGYKMLERFYKEAILKESVAEKVVKQNGQLLQPSHISENREKLLEIYRNGGYGAVEKWYYHRYGIKGLLYRIWNYIPGKCIE